MENVPDGKGRRRLWSTVALVASFGALLGGALFLVGSLVPEVDEARGALRLHTETDYSRRCCPVDVTTVQFTVPSGDVLDIEDNSLVAAVRVTPDRVATVEYNGNTDLAERVIFGGQTYVQHGRNAGIIEGGLGIVLGLALLTWGIRMRRRLNAPPGAARVASPL